MPATLIYIGREDAIRRHLFPLDGDLMLLDNLAHAHEELGGREPDPDRDGDGPFTLAYGPTALAAAGAHGTLDLALGTAWGRPVALLPDQSLTSTRPSAPPEVWRGIVLLNCRQAITLPRGRGRLQSLLGADRGGVR